MDTTGFWTLIEAARGGDRSLDGEEFAQALTHELVKVPQEEIVAFDRAFQAKLAESYRWELWGAAYVINGGCSDDCFDYFREFLISMGRDAYEAALRDPDKNLLEFPSEEDLEWEGPAYAAASAHEQVTGGTELPAGSPPLPAEPAGTPWEEEELPQLYPRLSERFLLTANHNHAHCCFEAEAVAPAADGRASRLRFPVGRPCGHLGCSQTWSRTARATENSCSYPRRFAHRSVSSMVRSGGSFDMVVGVFGASSGSAT